MHDRVTLPIELSNSDKIVQLAKAYADTRMGPGEVVASLDEESDIAELLNSDLSKYDLPNATCFILVRRSNQVYSPLEAAHLDCFAPDLSIVHQVSIIIPVENCDKAPMYWYDGDYTLGQITNKRGDPYLSIQWNSEPNYYNQELITTPTVCNIGMPHGALCPSDGSTRIVFTFRLLGNPSFDEVCEKVLTKINQ